MWCKMKKQPLCRTALTFLSPCPWPCSVFTHQMSPSSPVPGRRHPHSVSARQMAAFSRKCQAIQELSSFQGQVHAVRGEQVRRPAQGRQAAVLPSKHISSLSIQPPATLKCPRPAGSNFFPVLPKVAKSPWTPLPPAEAASTFLKLSTSSAFSLYLAEKTEN